MEVFPKIIKYIDNDNYIILDPNTNKWVPENDNKLKINYKMYYGFFVEIDKVYNYFNVTPNLSVNQLSTKFYDYCKFNNLFNINLKGIANNNFSVNHTDYFIIYTPFINDEITKKYLSILSIILQGSRCLNCYVNKNLPYKIGYMLNSKKHTIKKLNFNYLMNYQATL